MPSVSVGGGLPAGARVTKKGHRKGTHGDPCFRHLKIRRRYRRTWLHVKQQSVGGVDDGCEKEDTMPPLSKYRREAYILVLIQQHLRPHRRGSSGPVALQRLVVPLAAVNLTEPGAFSERRSRRGTACGELCRQTAQCAQRWHHLFRVDCLAGKHIKLVVVEDVTPLLLARGARAIHPHTSHDLGRHILPQPSLHSSRGGSRGDAGSVVDAL